MKTTAFSRPGPVHEQRERCGPNQARVGDVLLSSQGINDHEGKVEAHEERHMCQPEGDRPHQAQGHHRTDNPYSLIMIFGRCHLTIKAGGAVYVTRCAPVEVIPRSHKNCTGEIPALSNGTEVFVNPTV